jgi:hypothetical protein
MAPLERTRVPRALVLHSVTWSCRGDFFRLPTKRFRIRTACAFTVGCRFTLSYGHRVAMGTALPGIFTRSGYKRTACSTGSGRNLETRSAAHSCSEALKMRYVARLSRSVGLPLQTIGRRPGSVSRPLGPLSLLRHYVAGQAVPPSPGNRGAPQPVEHGVGRKKEPGYGR